MKLAIKNNGKRYCYYYLLSIPTYYFRPPIRFLSNSLFWHQKSSQRPYLQALKNFGDFISWRFRRIWRFPRVLRFRRLCDFVNFGDCVDLGDFDEFGYFVDLGDFVNFGDLSILALFDEFFDSSISSNCQCISFW